MSLKLTLEVLFIGDLIVMMSSTSGGVASRETLNLDRSFIRKGNKLKCGLLPAST